MQSSAKLSALPAAALAVVLSLLPGVAAAGPVSGLPWTSGAKGNLSCLAQDRGRAIDLEHVTVGAPANTWNDQVTAAKGWVSSTIKDAYPTKLLSPWLLTTGSAGDFAGCANGAYDSYWSQMATAWKNAAAASIPAKTVYIEPGWEANIGSHSHPWGVDSASQLPSYVACWRHVASVIRANFPAVILSWTNARRQPSALLVSQSDPGAEDLYGIMAYDSAAWPTEFSGVNANGDPTGFDTWRKYAASKGKALDVSEWGLRTQGDDPTYIANMFAWFKTNAGTGAGQVRYEAYQNNNSSSTDQHELCPTTIYPNAAAKYFSLWNAG